MYSFPHSESWFPAYWMDSSYRERCSEPDSTATVPESKASELFRAWESQASFQAWSGSVLIQPYLEQVSRFQELEKQFPAARFLAESCPESGSIPEC